MEPDGDDGVQEPMQRLNWTTIGLIAGLLFLILVIAYFATRGNADQDKLTNLSVSENSPASDEKLCASKATYDLIKRELFRRAAQLRGSDQAAYDQVASSAAVRMENPVMESKDSSTGAIHCSASLSLDLPPGIAVVGGRRTLTSDVDYTVQQAADGGGPVVLLQNADPIISPLATLARVAEPSPANSGESLNEAEPGPVEPSANEAPPIAAPTQSPPCPQGRKPVAGPASIARALVHVARSRCAAIPASPRSTGRWPANMRVPWRVPRLSSRRSSSKPATVSLDTATAARTIRASATPMLGGCVRSATSWKAAGRPDSRG